MNFDEIPIINDIETDDDVREKLKELNQPIVLPNETNEDRKQRLINLLQDEEDEDMESDEEEEEFYTPGTPELQDIRLKILKYSLQKSNERLNNTKKLVKTFDNISYLKHRRAIIEHYKKFELYGSQTIPGNTRALGSVTFNPKCDSIAVGSWDGSISILDASTLEIKQSHRNFHTEKVTLDFGDILVSGGNEGTIILWNDSKPTPIKQAHSNRITSLKLHHLNYLLSTSFDQTWKFWDLTKQTEVCQQEGHSKEIFTSSLHPDGSIFTTSGLDGIIKIWDLRSGRLLTNLIGHSKPVYSLDWSNNGNYLASGSGDCSIKIWDFRQLNRSNEEIYTIPAHTKLVSDLKFSNDGNTLISSSYDECINIWSVNNWIKIKSLKGHNDKVMNIDINNEESSIISSGWERTIKLWKIE
ncbi:unnamed protein product [Candida verbasci]|uniref:Pre-mRNA processing factor 4 (PRP4)-like domain-containing protein n=1 Tax=Candida verbasci TaxID=1227364 RepID=A0A9W4TTE9_9ASCO|nr:unnamed protein product [Candida verbasci]